MMARKLHLIEHVSQHAKEDTLANLIRQYVVDKNIPLPASDPQCRSHLEGATDYYFRKRGESCEPGAVPKASRDFIDYVKTHASENKLHQIVTRYLENASLPQDNYTCMMAVYAGMSAYFQTRPVKHAPSR